MKEPKYKINELVIYFSLRSSIFPDSYHQGIIQGATQEGDENWRYWIGSSWIIEVDIIRKITP